MILGWGNFTRVALVLPSLRMGSSPQMVVLFFCPDGGTVEKWVPSLNKGPRGFIRLLGPLAWNPGGPIQSGTFPVERVGTVWIGRSPPPFVGFFFFCETCQLGDLFFLKHSPHSSFLTCKICPPFCAVPDGERPRPPPSPSHPAFFLLCQSETDIGSSRLIA